jgi:hypothetical protein
LHEAGGEKIVKRDLFTIALVGLLTACCGPKKGIEEEIDSAEKVA